MDEVMHMGKRPRSSTKARSWRSTGGLAGDELERVIERREKASRACLAWSSRNGKSKPFPKHTKNDANDISVENISVCTREDPKLLPRAANIKAIVNR